MKIDSYPCHLDALDRGLQAQFLAGAVKRRKLGKPPVETYPQPAETRYRRWLFSQIWQWEQYTRRNVLPLIEGWVSEFRGDAWDEEVTQVMDQLTLQLREITPERSISLMATNIGQFTSQWNDRQWQKTMNAVLGVPLIGSTEQESNLVNSFVNENVGLITNLRESVRTDIEGVINRGIKQGMRHERIVSQIVSTGLPPAGQPKKASVFRKVRNRAKLISRDQVSKLNGQLTQERQTSAGITQYIWRTAGDERVRANHRNMNGRICRWDNPLVYLNDSGRWVPRSGIGGVPLHPGQDYQCRCRAEADFSSSPLFDGLT